MFQCEHIYMLTKCLQNMSTLHFISTILALLYSISATNYIALKTCADQEGGGCLDSLENHKWLWVSLENLAWTPFEKQCDPSVSNCFSKEVRKALREICKMTKKDKRSPLRRQYLDPRMINPLFVILSTHFATG